MKSETADPACERLMLFVEPAFLTEAEAEEAATLAARLRVPIRLEEVFPDDIWRAAWCCGECDEPHAPSGAMHRSP